MTASRRNLPESQLGLVRRLSRRTRITADAARDPERARGAAVALLARRDFATGELRQRLARQGFEPQAVTETLADLAERGLLNDARYVEHYVSYHASRGEGPLRIEADLKAAEVPEPLIQAALAAGPDWRARAREVRSRRFGAEAPTTWPQKVKQGRFLQYRGFSSDHIRAALGPDFDSDE